jgi:mRNA-degrading endonuclease YafQ of YafQ-DinJ toxin-antitoxin module
MESKYQIQVTSHFDRKFKRLYKKKNKNDLSKFFEILDLLSVNPYVSNLSTHPINHSEFGFVNASSITGDLRILWQFDDEYNLIILLLDIGGHSGGNSVYK